MRGYVLGRITQLELPVSTLSKKMPRPLKTHKFSANIPVDPKYGVLIQL